MAEKKITREEYMEAAARVRKYIEQRAMAAEKPCWVCAHKTISTMIIVCADELDAKILYNSGDYVMYKAVLYD